MQKSWKREHPQYTKYKLGDENLPSSPWHLWNTWHSDACTVLPYTNEVAISTCGTVSLQDMHHHLQPTLRMVLLKYYDEALGFCWYSKAYSEKGTQLSEYPYAELLWYVREMQRQMRVRGNVSTISSEEAKKYARERPRLSQISAYISQQSSVIESRDVLEQIYKKAQDMYKNVDIPIAEDWTGYVLQPTRFEFWQGREDRLHDRIVYTRVYSNSSHKKSAWNITRLQP